mgnify:CR=1 FL=1
MLDTSAQCLGVLPARMRGRRRTTSAAGLALTLDIHDDLDHIAPYWDEIAATGARASVFQSYGWLSAWARTAAAISGELPLIVTARCPQGRLRMLLPLGLERVGGQTVAGFLGQSHANYGLALLDPQFSDRLSSHDVRNLFRAIAEIVPIAAVRLDRQPASWLGRPNPFALTGGIVSANDSHVLGLQFPFDELYASRFSARTRSTLRRKARKAAGLGKYSLSEAADAAQRCHWTSTFLAAKSRQLREGGATDIFNDPALIAFYRTLARRSHRTDPQISISALEAGGQIGAIALTIDDGGRRYLLNTALVSDTLRDCSPGLLLLTESIASATAAGCTAYDFGPGDAAYKLAWAPEVVPLVTTVLPLRVSGLPAASFMTAAAVAKRTIKRNPGLWSLAQLTRRRLFGAGQRAERDA